MTDKDTPPEPLCLHCILLGAIGAYLQQTKEDGQPMHYHASPHHILGELARATANVLGQVRHPVDRQRLTLEMLKIIQQLTEEEARQNNSPPSLDDLANGTLH